MVTNAESSPLLNLIRPALLEGDESWFSASLPSLPAGGGGATTAHVLAHRLSLLEDGRAGHDVSLTVWTPPAAPKLSYGGISRRGDTGSWADHVTTAAAAAACPGTWLYRYPGRILAAGTLLARAAEEQRRRQVRVLLPVSTPI